MNQQENLLDIIKLIWQKRKTILYAALIAMIGSVIISLLLPNIYRSETIFYAANPSLGNPSSLSSDSKVIDQYGSNRDLDRLFAIAESGELFDMLNEKFDFFKHYDIDPNKSKAKTKLRKKFNSNFNLLKTEYDAFSLSFEDEDPEFSTLVANEARSIIDLLAQEVIKASQLTQINTYKSNIENQEKQLSIVFDSLTSAKNKYKIFNVDAQEEAMAELSAKSSYNLQSYTSKVKYYQEIRKNRDSIRKYKALLYTTDEEIKLLGGKMKLFNEGANEIIVLTKESKVLNSQVNLSKQRLKQLNVTYKSPFKAIHIVEKAFVPDNKYKPKRSIYVIATTLFTVIFTILALIVLHSFKSVDWKDVLSD